MKTTVDSVNSPRDRNQAFLCLRFCVIQWRRIVHSAAQTESRGQHRDNIDSSPVITHSKSIGLCSISSVRCSFELETLSLRLTERARGIQRRWNFLRPTCHERSATPYRYQWYLFHSDSFLFRWFVGRTISFLSYVNAVTITSFE
jgi:hypothetical protein